MAEISKQLEKTNDLSNAWLNDARNTWFISKVKSAFKNEEQISEELISTEFT